ANLRLRPAHDHIAHLEALWRQNVALGPVEVVQQRDARRAIRVILDGEDFGWHAKLVALEVDDAIAALHPAAAMPRGHATLVVAPRRRALLLQQRAFRLRPCDLVERRDRHATTSGRRWLIGAYWHGSIPSIPRRYACKSGID